MSHVIRVVFFPDCSQPDPDLGWCRLTLTMLKGIRGDSVDSLLTLSLNLFGN